MNVEQVNNDLKESIKEILGLCMDLKFKGHDAFFSYSPHVDWCSIRVHLNGWEENKDPDLIESIIFTTIDEHSDYETLKLITNHHDEVKSKLKEFLEG